MLSVNPQSLIKLICLIALASCFLFTIFLLKNEGPEELKLSDSKAEMRPQLKLELTYYRKNRECPELEDKVEIVESRTNPGKVERKVEVMDVISISKHIFTSGEILFVPWRPVVLCKEPKDPLVIEYLRSLIKKGKKGNNEKKEEKHGKGQDQLQKELYSKVGHNQLQQELHSKAGQYQLQQELYNKVFKQSKGFFIEYRSHQEDVYSNTIHLEQQLGWSGLLIDPMRFAGMTDDKTALRTREAFYMTGCLAEQNKTHIKTYTRDEMIREELSTEFGQKDLDNSIQKKEVLKQAKIICYTLESILIALERKSVDLLVLNSFGSEENVIENLPLKEYSIKAIVVKTTSNTQKSKLSTILGEENYSVCPLTDERFTVYVNAATRCDTL